MKKKLSLALLLISIVISSKAQIQHNQVQNLIASERYEDAIDTLEAMKNKDPKNQLVYFELGETVLQSFRADSFSDTKNHAITKALGYFNEGVKADSLNPLNYVGLGIVNLYRDGDTATANGYFAKALSFIPSKKKKIQDIHIITLIKIATAELYSPYPRIERSKAYINRLKELAPKSSDVYIAEGDILLYNAVNASNAISSYEKALSLNNNPFTNVRIGKVYLSARMTNDALTHFENAIREDSLFAPAYKGLGDLYYRTGKVKEAKTYYEKYMRLAGNNIPAKMTYTKALFLAKNYNEAIQSAQQILKVDSSRTYIYRIAGYSAYQKDPPDLDTARYYMERLFAKANKDQLITQDYLNYGKILLALHENEDQSRQGIQMLEKVYLEDTTNVELISDILKNAYIYKVFPVAAKYINIIINRGRNTTNNYLFSGKIYYQMKEYTKADSALANAIKQDSSNVEAYMWRGYVASAQDSAMKNGLARPYFEKVDSMGSSDPQKYKKELMEAYNYLGSYYVMSGQPSDLNKAEVYFKKLLALDPNNRDVQSKSLHSLAYISAKKKNYDKAKEYYQTILQYDPNDDIARKGMSYINKMLKSTNKK